MLAEPVPLTNGSLLWSYPRGWGCHREQLVSSKPWLQGWALEVPGLPHSTAMSWIRGSGQGGLLAASRICPCVLKLPGLVG